MAVSIRRVRFRRRRTRVLLWLTLRRRVMLTLLLAGAYATWLVLSEGMPAAWRVSVTVLLIIPAGVLFFLWWTVVIGLHEARRQRRKARKGCAHEAVTACGTGGFKCIGCGAVLLRSHPRDKDLEEP